MAEVSPTSGTDDQESLAILRAHTGENCIPSEASVMELEYADLLLIAGQFVGAGKDTFIKAFKSDRSNLPSYTNRELRVDEIEGVHKKKRSLPELAKKAVEGDFLELEEIRPGFFYATPAEFALDVKYMKDLELRGAMRLRSYVPDTKIVLPLPPIQRVAQGVTEWERRVILREGMQTRITKAATQDLGDRLEGVVEESDRIIELDLIEDPNTLLVVNNDLQVALSTAQRFIETGEKPATDGLKQHVEKIRDLAATALAAA
jgi:guanylate kinase